MGKFSPDAGLGRVGGVMFVLTIMMAGDGGGGPLFIRFFKKVSVHLYKKNFCLHVNDNNIL